MAEAILQPMWIGGEPRESARIEPVHSPYDGSEVGRVAVGGPEDVDQAISAAVESFGVLRSTPTHRRAAILEDCSRGLEREATRFATLIARESGKPITQARAEVARAVVTFRLGADEARRLGGETLPVDLEPRGEGRLCLYTRVPRGPLAAFAPFNFPLNLSAHKISPAIAVGATVVLKPPPQCPLVAYALAELLHEVGLPPGALNVVHCTVEAAGRLVEDERIAMLSFTGSDAVGWELKRRAGKKHVLLELGGNAPCIVDEGVDVDQALERIVPGAWAHAGQVCIRVQRLLVHSSLFGRFLEGFVERTRAVPCGDPLDERTVVGPLIDRQHVERVREWVEEARSAGARVHCGGEIEGQVMRPVILTDASPELRVCKDEVFGPVTVVEPFERFEEALAACNATRFGLQAGVFTRDLGRALLAHRELRYGGVMINDVPTFRVDNFPYGGTKDSGIGREGVHFAALEMSEPRTLVIRWDGAG